MLGVTLFGIFLTPSSTTSSSGSATSEPRRARPRSSARNPTTTSAGARRERNRGRSGRRAITPHPSGNGVVHGTHVPCRALTVRATCVNAGTAMPVPSPRQAERGPGRARDRAQHGIDRPDLRGRRRDALAGAAAGLPSRRPPPARAGLDYWEHLSWRVVDRLDDVVAALGPRPALVVQHQGESGLYRCTVIGPATH